MKKSIRELGEWGESRAAVFLNQHGYEILERNARTPYGEIDLIAVQKIKRKDGQTSRVLVFVEVKTRTTDSYGFPEDSITVKKQEHILDSAKSYLQDHPELAGDWRVDVISIEKHDPNKASIITHFENAI